MGFNKEVGERIYSLRKSKQMSRVDLGKKVNLHETTIKKYEDGNIKSLGTDKLEEFALALDTTTGFLMGWDGGNPCCTRIPVYGCVPAGVRIVWLDSSGCRGSSTLYVTPVYIK